MKIIYAIPVLLMIASNAFAYCEYEGKHYPTNTIINGYVCTEDGSWMSAE